MNLDNLVNILDAVIIINYIIGASEASFCLEDADINLDQFVNIMDIVLLIDQIVNQSSL